ncbi:MAG: 2'-5' RNA ligase family protein [Nocardioidaceae bacterium]
MRTIGVAIAIPEPYGSELQQHRESFGDAQAVAIPSHVTLLPPTDVDDANLDQVEKHLDLVASSHAPFRLRLRGTATFRPVSPVVFVVVAVGISSCEVLAGRVRQGRLSQDLRFPYHPHVTVAHDLDDASLDHAFEALAGFDCAFEVGSFHLYTHDEDGVWRPSREFVLKG